MAASLRWSRSEGWHSYLEKQPGGDWSVVDGTIQLKKTNQDPRADFADLVTDGEFTNFDLKLEWKAQPCIDSGVMFFVHEAPEYRDSYDTGLKCRSRTWRARFPTAAC